MKDSLLVSRTSSQKKVSFQFDPPEEKKPSKCGKWLKETFVDDKWFWLGIIVLLVANIWIHQYLHAGEWFGFVMASYSAIANDSIQTLGTFIASNKDTCPWWGMWLWVGFIFLGTTSYSFWMYDGDISY